MAPSSSGDQPQDSIDSIDREILKLAEDRNALVHALCELDGAGLVGRVAAASARIDALVEKHCAEKNCAEKNCAEENFENNHAGETPGISQEAKANLLRHLSSVCLQTVHAMRSAYLGPMHSYSHLAAIKYFGDASTLTPVASIPAVFESVTRGDTSAGIVPIENSTDGRVVDTLGMFVHQDAQICGEVLIPIHHNLLSRTARENITEVQSKPQALSQCRSWLASQLPGATLVPVSSTAAAAKMAAEKPGVAAVASIEAGRQYGLDVIDANIEDNANNVTRFAVSGKEQPSPTGNDKTAILFQVNHEPGALAGAMMIFKDHGLNLTWIESFPMPEKPSEYLFFVELTGHREEKAVREAIACLEKIAQRLTVLGSYPIGMLVS